MRKFLAVFGLAFSFNFHEKNNKENETKNQRFFLNFFSPSFFNAFFANQNIEKSPINTGFFHVFLAHFFFENFFVFFLSFSFHFATLNREQKNKKKGRKNYEEKIRYIFIHYF